MSNVLPRFRVDAVADGDATEIAVVEGVSGARRYRVLGKSSGHYESFFGELARDLGTRPSRQFDEVPPTTTEPPWKPLITESLCPRILSGYGDPAAIKTEEGYFLVATSNDALMHLPSCIQMISSAGTRSGLPSSMVTRRHGHWLASRLLTSGRPRSPKSAQNIG